MNIIKDRHNFQNKMNKSKLNSLISIENYDVIMDTNNIDISFQNLF